MEVIVGIRHEKSCFWNHFQKHWCLSNKRNLVFAKIKLKDNLTAEIFEAKNEDVKESNAGDYYSSQLLIFVNCNILRMIVGIFI